LLCELRDITRADFLLDVENRVLQDVHLFALREIFPVSGWPAVLGSVDENCHQFVVAEAVFDCTKAAL
jgi:hypothetical protein